MSPQSIWTNFFTWRCLRHIPTSVTNPASFDACSMCRYPRPPDDQRPGLDGNLPPLKPISSPPSRVEPEVLLSEAPVLTLVEVPRSSRVEVETALVAEQDLRTFTAVDQPVPLKVNGNGHRVRRLCPGPGCRKVVRRDSPYCSKVCADRCYRLRMKSARALLTDQEVVHLNRILQALDGRNAA